MDNKKIFKILLVLILMLNIGKSILLAQDNWDNSNNTITGDEIPYPGDQLTSFWDDDVTKMEEELELFYNFGRFLHIAPYIDYLIPSGPRANIYVAGVSIGLKISYFLDWNLAIYAIMSMGFIPISIENKDPATVANVPYLEGISNMFVMFFGAKYYLNFYDVSSSIASVNPYVGVLFGFIAQQDSIDNYPTSSTGGAGSLPPEYSDFAPGALFTFGIEFPVFKKEILFGFEFEYFVMGFDPYNMTLYNTSSPYRDLDYSGDFVGVAFNVIWSL